MTNFLEIRYIVIGNFILFNSFHPSIMIITRFLKDGNHRKSEKSILHSMLYATSEEKEKVLM